MNSCVQSGREAAGKGRKAGTKGAGRGEGSRKVRDWEEVRERSELGKIDMQEVTV